MEEILTAEQKNILKHTMERSVRRNYCGDSKDMQILCEIGFMRYVCQPTWCFDKFFTITKKGENFYYMDLK